MTYQAHITSKLPAHEADGYGRYSWYCALSCVPAEALNVSPKDIQAMLLGGHGDTMVPFRYTTVAGIPVTELIDKDKLHAIPERTKVGGGELCKTDGNIGMVCTGVWAAADGGGYRKRSAQSIPGGVKLEGEYGIKDCYLGVPVILGKNGVEKNHRTPTELRREDPHEASRKAVREVMDVLDKIG